MTDNYLKYYIFSLIYILIGYLIKLYLKKTGLNNLNKILGIGVFWLKVFANILIIIGILSLIMFSISFYYHLQLQGYF